MVKQLALIGISVSTLLSKWMENMITGYGKGILESAGSGPFHP